MCTRLSQLDFDNTPPPGFDTRQGQGPRGLIARTETRGPREEHCARDRRGGRAVQRRSRRRARGQGPARAWRHQIARDAHPIKPRTAHSNSRLRYIQRYITSAPNLTTASTQKLQNANHLAPGKVRPALSLVGYPDEVAEALHLLSPSPHCSPSVLYDALSPHNTQ